MTPVQHLYLHVPFCRRRCPYCDYAVTVDQAPQLHGWAEAMRAELTLVRENGVELDSLQTILVGGGTPSVLGAEAMREVRSILGGAALQRITEWTAEANPEDVDDRLLEGWASAGVTRVNLGLQSLRAPALEWLGRSHDPAQGRRALRHVAEADLESWGVDFLFGLPEKVETDPTETLAEVIAIGPPHVSLYELVAEPGTPLGESVEDGRAILPGEDARADQFLALRTMLVQAGYEHYELTGFALEGHRCRHTRGILGGGSWLGLGPGAHSNVEGLRSRNLVDWPGYCRSVAQGTLPRAEISRLEPEQAREEGFRLGLRSADGLRVEALGSRGRALAQSWIARELAHPDSERVRLTPDGWLRLDELSHALSHAEADSGYLLQDIRLTDHQ